MGKGLKGKVAIVTGAGRGVGRAVALLMAQEGARVVVNDAGVELDGRGGSTQVADQTVAEIRASGGEAVANYDSVATMEGGERIVQTALDHFGCLDILVNCAGILRDRMIFNMTEEEWDAVIQVHLKGTFAVVKPACVYFRRHQRPGRIITFTSRTGLIGNPGQANYAAAKDGIVGFTRVVAKEMARYGVTVNSVAPAALTRMTRNIPQVAQQQKELRGIQSLVGSIQRMGEPEDVAPMVVWLASDEAAHVTGQVFFCTGGQISLMGHPEPLRRITKKGRWSVEEIAAIFPTTLGMDLVNPAPSATP